MLNFFSTYFQLLEKTKVFFKKKKKSTLACEECDKNVGGNQHPLFLSWGWMCGLPADNCGKGIRFSVKPNHSETVT